VTAKVQRLDDHILDAEYILTTEAGAWFAHNHEHTHVFAIGQETHAHRHDHRRRSKRGDYDHHPIAATRPTGGGS